MRMFLNVGGNSKDIAVPSYFAGWEHHLLDIDPAGKPDLLCDARNLRETAAGAYDAVYCSHNLEHYYRHDVTKVLAGFLHVLNDEGFAVIRVPDIAAVMRETLQRGLDIDDTLYDAGFGPITVADVLYGYGKQIEDSGQDFFAHKTGFTEKSLVRVLNEAGFVKVFSGSGNREAYAFAFKSQPKDWQRAMLSPPRPKS